MNDKIKDKDINKPLRKTRNKYIQSLAGTILNETDEPLDVPFDEEDVPETPLVTDPIPQQKTDIEESKEPPKPIQFNNGLTKNTAFIVYKQYNEVFNILKQHFGPNNGDYFIHSENTTTSYIQNERKRFKCILIEDKNNFKYVLWFDLTLLGAIY